MISLLEFHSPPLLGTAAERAAITPAELQFHLGRRFFETDTGKTWAAVSPTTWTDISAFVVGAGGGGPSANVAVTSIATGSNTIGGVTLPQYTPSGGRLPIELDAAALAALETITVATINAALPAGNNNIGDVDVATVPADPFGANADALVAAGATGSLSAKLRRVTQGLEDLKTLIVLGAGGNAIGTVGVTSLSALVTGSALVGRVNVEPQTANGLSVMRIISAASTNATSVKGSAGQVYTILAHNINAAVRYLKLYNKATAPTVGTDTPVMTLPIPADATGKGFVLDTGGMGIAFSVGIALAITTGVADADTGAVAANEIVVNLCSK